MGSLLLLPRACEAAYRSLHYHASRGPCLLGLILPPSRATHLQDDWKNLSTDCEPNLLYGRCGVQVSEIALFSLFSGIFVLAPVPPSRLQHD